MGFLLAKRGRVPPGVVQVAFPPAAPPQLPSQGWGTSRTVWRGAGAPLWRQYDFSSPGDSRNRTCLYFSLAVAEPLVLPVLPLVCSHSHQLLMKGAQQGWWLCSLPASFLHCCSPISSGVCSDWLWTGLCTGPALDGQPCCTVGQE